LRELAWVRYVMTIPPAGLMCQATIIRMSFAYIPQFHEIEQHPLTGILVGALTGTGLFEALAKLVELAFTRVQFIRKFILGASYLEGCWVGST
jgi:hypothetical protein